MTDKQLRRVRYYSEKSGGFTPEPGPPPVLLLDEHEDKVIAVTRYRKTGPGKPGKRLESGSENRQNVLLLCLRNRQNRQAAAVLATAENTKSSFGSPDPGIRGRQGRLRRQRERRGEQEQREQRAIEPKALAAAENTKIRQRQITRERDGQPDYGVSSAENVENVENGNNANNERSNQGMYQQSESALPG